jgi:hypothetical protein
MFHGILWGSMRFNDVPVNQSVPTEANRGLTSYIAVIVGGNKAELGALHCRKLCQNGGGAALLALSRPCQSVQQ